MEANIETAISVALIALVGVLFSQLIPWWRDRHSRRIAARAAFRADIERELGSMLTSFPKSSPEIDGRLKQVFPALESAVREFRNHVPWWQKRGFNYAWLCYYCAYPDQWDSHSQCYHHYLGSHSPGEPTPDIQAVFRANVEHLLSYAKET